ncbi:hypothetical protein CERSUDRAFT_100761 [Gelatoporia subvermispora B]|uniref:Uncharacterized protein n=1 Tax=Ceriporiopsis subvermispora (strain B) TaxID=914234 RepID=M2P6U3_CERS8|nr:hypothetical protein CERSUDRAFT_100761 [Gelatoporia subvermispora B]
MNASYTTSLYPATISQFIRGPEPMKFSGTTYRKHDTEYTIPVFSVSEPEDYSNVYFVLLGPQYQYAAMLADDFKRRTEATSEEEVKLLFKTDQDTMRSGMQPFPVWRYTEGARHFEIITGIDHPFYTMTGPKITRASTWKSKWATMAQVVDDLYRPSKGPWSVTARFFTPNSTDYTVVLTPGTWGTGGSAVGLSLLGDVTQKVIEDIKLPYPKSVRVMSLATLQAEGTAVYTCIATHPFGFYSTWMRSTELAAWHRELCAEGRSANDLADGMSRRQPTRANLGELRKLLGEDLLDSWNQRLKKAQFNEIAPVVRLLQGKSAQDYSHLPAELSRVVEQLKALTHEEVIVLKECILFRAKKPLPKYLPALITDKIRRALLHDYLASSTLTFLTAGKVKDAVGAKRKKSQVAVMFNVSASRIAEALWNPERGTGKRAPVVAEWLHRSAFSFGGLGFPKKWDIGAHVNQAESKAQKSQHGNNMIFGTTEANTCMLRFVPDDMSCLYEMAIKDALMMNQDSHPWITAAVYTALEDTKATHPYSAWYSPTLTYHYRLSLGKTAENIDGINLDGFAFEHSFDLFSRYRPFRIEAEVDKALMMLFANMIKPGDHEASHADLDGPEVEVAIVISESDEFDADERDFSFGSTDDAITAEGFALPDDEGDNVTIEMTAGTGFDLSDDGDDDALYIANMKEDGHLGLADTFEEEASGPQKKTVDNLPGDVEVVSYMETNGPKNLKI